MKDRSADLEDEMDKYETLRNSVVWAVTHYGLVNTEGIIERLRETVLELDSEQLQNTSSNSDYAKCSCGGRMVGSMTCEDCGDGFDVR